MTHPETLRKEAVSLQQRRDWQSARSDSSTEKKFTVALLMAWNIKDYVEAAGI
jgi:hypothetical protein